MKKKVLAFILVVAMVLSVLPMSIFATESVKYIERSWDGEKVIETERECTDYTVFTSSDDSLEDGKWYVVDWNWKIGELIQVTGTANLIIADDVTLTISEGIVVSDGSTLNIYAQSGGSGTVYATNFSTLSIDGKGNINIHGGIIKADNGIVVGEGGNINIYGGTVNATGGDYGAGIGGGYEGNGGNVTIYGGTVNATGGDYGAGIGGGYEGNGGNVTIYGGTVNATAGDYGAGIGGGDGGNCGNVTINGGIITANNNKYGAGIGGGGEGNGGNITINGGNVTATSKLGAGIGGGIYGNGGTITINGGTVTATSESGAGIGGGYFGSDHGTLDIASNAIIKVNDAEVTAEQYIQNRSNNVFITLPEPEPINYIDRVWNGEKIIETEKECTRYIVVNKNTTTFQNGKWYVVNDDVAIEEHIQVTGTVNLILADGATLTADAGIGVSEDNTLKIFGQSDDSGILEVSGLEDFAAIGGGRKENCGTVIINGGTVNAIGNAAAEAGGAGIGGGYRGNGGTVIINGGNITANGSWNGAGIGGGNEGAGGSITVNGGKVTATAGYNAAAIGGGAFGEGGNIAINGGKVTAIGNDNGAGIGGGLKGSGGNITVSGGTVNATGGIAPGNYGNIGGAGIGGGTNGVGGNVTVSGGTVTATGGNGAPGIGGGNGHGTLDIALNAVIKVDGTQVTAEEYIQNRNNNVNISIPVFTYITRTWDGEKIIETEKICKDFTLIDENTTTFEDGKWYVVNADVTNGNRIVVNGTANLILTNGKKLTSRKGIAISEGNTLNVFGQSGDSGKLEVNGRFNVGDSAIGGSEVENGGTVAINGGVVTAYSEMTPAIRGTITLGAGILFRAGRSAEVITVAGDASNVERVNGERYFATTVAHEHSYDSNACTFCGASAFVVDEYDVLTKYLGNGGDVVIPEFVEKIGFSAFEGCTNLTSVQIPEFVSEIRESAFEGCTNLASVQIPEFVVEIGKSAFEGCTKLTSVQIPECVDAIGDRAFAGCAGLTSVQIPEFVSEIRESAFEGCTNLASVQIPESVEEIWKGAFAGCTSLTSIVIPESVTVIQEGVFAGCTGLTSIVIPESVEGIGSDTFSYCTNLTSVQIPEGVNMIDRTAFSYCTNLKSITIPASVTTFGPMAFYHSGLTEITVTDSIPVFEENNVFYYTNISTVNYPCDNDLEAIKAAYGGYVKSGANYNAIHGDLVQGDLVSEATCLNPAVYNVKCSECDAVFGTMEVGEVGDHIWLDATCTEPKTCSVCHVTEAEPLGHTWVTGDLVSEATCTTPAVYEKKCAECDSVSGTMEVGKALGHTWVDATCTEPKTCSVCHITEGIALGHTWVTGDLASEATCLKSAVYNRECSVCHATDTIEIGDPLGHAFVFNSKGVAKCKRCSFTPPAANIKTNVDSQDISVGDIIKAGVVINPYENNYDAYMATTVDGKFLGVFTPYKKYTAPTCLKCVSKSSVDKYGNFDIKFESACLYNAATCQAPATCIYCGATKGEIGSHNVVNGVCTVCGAHFEAFEFDAKSLALDSALAFKFKGYLYDLNPAQDAYMEFKIGDIRSVNIALKDAVKDEKGRYVFTCFLNALEVDEKIEAIFRDGEFSVERQNPLSVTDYLDLVLANHTNGTEEDIKIVNLVNAISNYAHYAQLALDETHTEYEVGNGGKYVGTAARTEITLHTADELEKFVAVKEVADGFTDVKSTSRSLVLDDETAIVIYITPASKSYVPNVKVTDKNGNDVAFECELQDNGKYKVVIRGIAAHKLADNYTVDIDNGKLVYTNLSALSYAYSILSNSNSEAYKNAVSTLYDYYLATIEYKEFKNGGHAFGTLIPTKDSTCTETGLKAHYQCSICGKYFDENKVETALQDLIIEAKGHTFATYFFNKTEHWHECTVCGAPTEREPHNFVPASYYDKECICGCTKDAGEEIIAFGHVVDLLDEVQARIEYDEGRDDTPPEIDFDILNRCIEEMKEMCYAYCSGNHPQQEIMDLVDELYRLYNENIFGSNYECSIVEVLYTLKQELGYWA